MKRSVAYCHLVASVLAADGIMENTERSFLERTMAMMCLDDEEKEQVKNFEEADKAVNVIRKLPEAARRKLIDDLIQATLADGKISPHETAAVKKITEALGL